MYIKIDNGFIESTFKLQQAKLKLSILHLLLIIDTTDLDILKLRYAIKDPAEA
jgi:hypothetical protein